MKLSENLKKTLQKMDMTVAQLSRATGVPTNTIHGWLYGSTPNLKNLEKVSSYLEMTIDDLLYSTASKMKSANTLEQVRTEIELGNFMVILKPITRKEIK